MNGTNYQFPLHEAFSTHLHPFWAQKFVSGSSFQIPLACITPIRNNMLTRATPMWQLSVDIAGVNRLR